MPITENAVTPSYSDVTNSTFVPRRQDGSIIEPSVIKVSREMPNIASNSSMRVYSKWVGYSRYRFDVEYAPMTKEDAHMLLSAFERFQGSSIPFYHMIPTNTLDTVAGIQNRNGRTMLNMPVFDTYDLSNGNTTGHAGDDVFVLCDGKVERFPSNLLVKFTNHSTVYKTISQGIRERDGRVAFKIYPALEQDIDQAAIVAREAYDDYQGQHTLIKVRIEDDEFEYGTNGSGLVVVKYSLVEDL